MSQFKYRELLIAVMAGAWCAVGLAQGPAALPPALPDAPATAAPTAAIAERDAMLSSLPQLRDEPASLYAPPAQRSTGPMPIDSPYFTRDPLLDAAEFPEPGWFGGAELQIVKPHLLTRMSGTVQNSAQKADGSSTLVALPNAPLDWALSPRFVLGYRLPSGFGEFAAAYRFLDSTGSEGFTGPNGPASLKSGLSFNIIDFDYNSREISCLPQWDMDWTVGVRIITLFFDSKFNQPLDQAAAGNGIFQARQFDNINAGVGPHAALGLARRLGNSGWSLRFRADYAIELDWAHDGFSATSTALGPTGQPLVGTSTDFFHQGTSIINVQLGLGWQPRQYPWARLFAGYQYERWFALQRVVDSGSHGELWDQGAVLQATFRF